MSESPVAAACRRWRDLLEHHPREMAEDCGAVAINLLCGRDGQKGALELLAALEWPQYRGRCSWCNGARTHAWGHLPNCKLAALLRRAAEELGATEEGGGS